MSCKHRGRALVGRETDSRCVALVDQHRAQRLNSPNDLAMADDGALWFTDPVFGITQPDEGVEAEPEQQLGMCSDWMAIGD